MCTPADRKYEQYAYDAVGNLKTKQDRAGQVTKYDYDDLYRLIKVDYPGTTPDVSFQHDKNGNPVTASNSPSATVTYTYDGLDRVLTETSVIGGASYPVVYTHDRASRLTQLTYPDSSVLRYTYDALGRTREVKGGATPYATFAYYADDRIKDVAYGNGIVQSYQYHERGWPKSIKATSGSNTYLDLGYLYDGSGNVRTMGSAGFSYDALDRLWTASGGFGSHTYTYDAIGNRKQLEIVDPTTSTLRPNGRGSTTEWSKYPSRAGSNWDRVDEDVSDGDSTYVYETTPGDTDLYTLQDLTQSGPIKYVKVTAVARAPTKKACQSEGCFASVILRVNGYGSAAKTVYASYTTITNAWWTNPATGQPWTVAEVNALQAGVELFDTNTQARVTQLYVTVYFGALITYTYNDGPAGMNELTSLTRDGVVTSFGYDLKKNMIWKQSGSSNWTYEWGTDGLLSKALFNGAQKQKYTYDGLGRRVKVEGISSSA